MSLIVFQAKRRSKFSHRSGINPLIQLNQPLFAKPREASATTTTTTPGAPITGTALFAKPKGIAYIRIFEYSYNIH